MTLRPNPYDESIVLTGAMQVVAGQVPYRDFYYLYGPAGIYIPAALFKLFGQSILVERLLDLLFRALTAASVFVIASKYLRRSLAIWTASTAPVPVCWLNLVSTALLIPVFEGTIRKRGVLLAGCLAGITFLFRFDLGVALFVIHICIVLTGAWLRVKTNRLALFLLTFWPYPLGFIVLVLPSELYYLSLSSIQPLIFDAITFPSKYYHSARYLPFPGISLKSLDNLAIYLPVPIVALSLYSFGVNVFKTSRDQKSESSSDRKNLFGCSLDLPCSQRPCARRTLSGPMSSTVILQ